MNKKNKTKVISSPSPKQYNNYHHRSTFGNRNNIDDQNFLIDTPKFNNIVNSTPLARYTNDNKNGSTQLNRRSRLEYNSPSSLNFRFDLFI